MILLLKGIQEMHSGRLYLTPLRRQLLARSWVSPKENQACFNFAQNCGSGLNLELWDYHCILNVSVIQATQHGAGLSYVTSFSTHLSAVPK